MPDRTILAFDTSAAHCAAALLSGDRVLGSAFEEMTRGQAERLMPLVSEVMERAGIVSADLDAVGVGIGPGNFTGIRISVAAARGLALGRGIQAVGVSGFDVLGMGRKDRFLACLTAPRGGRYLQWRSDGVAEGLSWFAEGPEDDVAPTVIDWSKAIINVARIAAAKLDAGGPLDRPAPLYIREADAAPARPVPPVR